MSNIDKMTGYTAAKLPRRPGLVIKVSILVVIISVLVGMCFCIMFCRKQLRRHSYWKGRACKTGSLTLGITI